jgi:hypothetical protein
MARKGKMVTGGLTTKGPGKKATTRVQTKSEVNRVIKQGKRYQEDVVELPTDLYENVAPEATGQKKSLREINAEASRDFKKMEKAEGDPFALKYREGTRYTPTKRDVKKGVVEDPGVFKGADAPFAPASSQQKQLFRQADAKVKSSTARGDRDGAEEARNKMNILGQFPGASGGVSHACFGSNCSNEVKPSESVLCPTCESRDSREVQIGSPSTSAVSRGTVRAKKSA